VAERHDERLARDPLLALLLDELVHGVVDAGRGAGHVRVHYSNLVGHSARSLEF
jgi:hypothetical protein